jgi:cytochrome c55X
MAKPVARRPLAWAALAFVVGLTFTASAAANDELAAQGRKLYVSYCARCHGVEMVTTGAAYDLRRFPADQKERFERSVLQGVRAMPAWSGTLAPAEVNALWAYLETRRTP